MAREDIRIVQIWKLRYLISSNKDQKVHFFYDFQKAVISQPIDGFFCSTPEMKAGDAYVPFLRSKLLNKSEISEIILAQQFLQNPNI